VVNMSEGFDFLGFRIQWKRKRGTNTWHPYTFIADRPIRSLKAKVRALTNRTSQQSPASVLVRLGQIMRGWSTYFRHAVSKHTFSALTNFVWHRVARWLMVRHAGCGRISADGSRPWWPVATTVGGREDLVQPGDGPGHPVPLPSEHPDPLVLRRGVP
jgi:hypothetical protein